MTNRTWYFVRHGETYWNAEKRMQGQWESHLNESGKGHADTNGRWLSTLGIEHTWASPQVRVRETVEIINRHMIMEPVFDDRLKEWSAGDWQGELYADIAKTRPVEWDAWVADQYNYRPPNGENFVDLENRAESFFADVAEHSAGVVAIVAHGFIIRVMVSRLVNIAPAEVLTIKQTNDTVIRVTQTASDFSVDHFVGGKGPFEGLPKGDQGAA